MRGNARFLKETERRPEPFSHVWGREFHNFHLRFMIPYIDFDNWDKKIKNPRNYKHSRLATSQTYGEFYTTLEEVAKEVTGMNREELSEVVLVIYGNHEDYERRCRELYQLLRPVWVALRERGYNKNDLWR